MGRTSGGYTIAEVMIVLAVSGVLLFSALTIVNGQQQKTSFNQAMQDVASMIQNYATQIQAGSYPGSEAYGCTVSGSPPTAQLTNSPGGSDGSCVFLGRAFEFEPGSGGSVIRSIVVIGSRTDSNGNSVTSVDDANPEPARLAGSSSPDSYNLIDTYNIGGGATVVASNGSTNNWDLIGLYSQLEGSSADSGTGNQALSLRGYPYPAGSYPYPSSQLTQCIEEVSTTPDCMSPTNLNQWNLCLSDGSQTAAVEVYSNPSGLNTKVNYSPTAGECG